MVHRLFNLKPFPTVFLSRSSSSASSPPALEDYSQEDLDFVILKEVEGKEMNIVYRNGATVDATALETLCDRVGWPRRPIFKVEAALANSFLVGTLSLEPKTSTQKPSMLTLHSSADNGSAARLIGLARCTSDGAFNATVWDVVIDPEFQGRGLGKALVECMVRTLLKRDITNITLFADGKAIEFYKQMGFEADPEGIRGMFFIPKL